MKTYKIVYNDFGLVYIVADDFKDAITKFEQQFKFDYTIKSIEYVGEGVK